jgi:hypothetical protein
VNNYRLSVRVPPGAVGRAFQPGSGGLLSGAVFSVASGATAIMDETLTTPQINIADGAATLLSTNGGMNEVTKCGSGNLLLGASSALSVGAFDITQGETVLSTGGQLTATAGVATNGTGQAFDGHVTIWLGAILSLQGGTLNCATLTNLGICECLSGSLIVTSNVTNSGTLRLLGNAQLHFAGAFGNSGVLDIMPWNGTLPQGVVNTGTILDRGAIKLESFAVKNGGVDLTIMGYAGHTYQLQTSSVLNPASWTNVGSPQTGAGKMLDFRATNAVNANVGFYRAAVY